MAPFDGAGNFSLPAGSDVATGDTIIASDLNTPLDDIEAALSQVLLRSGVAPMTGDLDLGGFDVINAGGSGGTFLTEDDTGSSGHKIPYLDAANTWSAANSFTGNLALGDIGDSVSIKGTTVHSAMSALLSSSSVAALRSAIGVGTEDSPAFTGLTVGSLSVTTAAVVPVASVGTMLDSLPDGGAISITGAGIGTVFVLKIGGVWQRRTNSTP